MKYTQNEIHSVSYPLCARNLLITYSLKWNQCALTMKQIYRKNSQGTKIQDGAGHHFEISQMAITPPFLNGFATNLIQTSRITSLDNFYSQNLYPTKSKMQHAERINYYNNCLPYIHHVPAEAKIRCRCGRHIWPRHSIWSGCRGTKGVICLDAKFQLRKALQKYIPILADVQLQT